MKVADSIVFVTGANGGIGTELVLELLKGRVGKVYVAAREIEKVSKLVELDPKRVKPICLDVTNEKQIASAAEQCSDVQILINNAGISLNQGIISASNTSSLEREFDVNCLGMMKMCRAFAPILAGTGGGAIVNMLSLLAKVHLPFSGSYSVSKAAALSLTHGIRAELAAQKTLVIAVMPGTVDTTLAAEWPEPKVAPSEVARETVEAIELGQEDVYPGDQAKQISAQLVSDPKGVEKYMANFLPGKSLAGTQA
ncbi:MAG: SDR family oxidoreductase [Leptolyngbya sp.]|nr:SDR family oxidoreductase [Candidatus Melainabacteria bacterium]